MRGLKELTFRLLHKHQQADLERRTELLIVTQLLGLGKNLQWCKLWTPKGVVYRDNRGFWWDEEAEGWLCDWRKVHFHPCGVYCVYQEDPDGYDQLFLFASEQVRHLPDHEEGEQG